MFSLYPGESIRPADPVVFDRIRIGFHRNPTFFIKKRSDPTEFLSDSDPDFVGIRRNPMKSGSDLVGFQSYSVEFRRNPGRNPSEIISIRRDPITPQSHGYVFLCPVKSLIIPVFFSSRAFGTDKFSISSIFSQDVIYIR
jgi:hypothetical protein